MLGTQSPSLLRWMITPRTSTAERLIALRVVPSTLVRLQNLCARASRDFACFAVSGIVLIAHGSLRRVSTWSGLGLRWQPRPVRLRVLSQSGSINTPIHAAMLVAITGEWITTVGASSRNIRPRIKPQSSMSLWSLILHHAFTLAWIWAG